jgi:hypothetical protein
MLALADAVAIAAASLLQSNVFADEPADFDSRVREYAKHLKERDIEAAQESVEKFDDLLKSSLNLKDSNGAVRARAQLRAAKLKLASAKSRRVEDYFTKSRLIVREQVEHERVEELNRQNRAEEQRLKDQREEQRQERINASRERNGRLRDQELAEMRKVGPMFIDSAVVATNEIGLPEVNFAATNTSGVAVEGFELEIKCLNSFDEPVVSMVGKDTVTASVGRRVAPGGQSHGSIQLSLHRTTSKAVVRVTRVKLANGDVWSQTAEEAAKIPGAVFTALTPR